MPVRFEDLGLGDEYTNRLIGIESGGNPLAITGRNKGLGQFSQDQFGTYGITDWRDPQQQIRAIQMEAEKNAPVLEQILGRPASGREQYLAHQQGLSGAKALYGNPDVPAWQAIRGFYKNDDIAKKAITGNIPYDNPLRNVPVDQITSSMFTGMWHNRFDRNAPVQYTAGTAAMPTAMQEMQAQGLLPKSAPAALSNINLDFQTPSAPQKSAEDRIREAFAVLQSQQQAPALASATPLSGLLATYGGRQ